MPACQQQAGNSEKLSAFIRLSEIPSRLVRMPPITSGALVRPRRVLEVLIGAQSPKSKKLRTPQRMK
eukprot:1510915-Amphidinium_carterae.1